MDISEAKAEGARWLAHLENEKEKAAKLAALAGKRRRGEMDRETARREVEAIQGRGVRVYDGARLAEAVRVLIEAT